MGVENRVVIRTGRVDIVPGDVFSFSGKTYRALTYPHGAGRRFDPPGIWMDFSPPYDPEVYTPEIGELTAVELAGASECC